MRSPRPLSGILSLPLLIIFLAVPLVAAGPAAARNQDGPQVEEAPPAESNDEDAAAPQTPAPRSQPRTGVPGALPPEPRKPDAPRRAEALDPRSVAARLHENPTNPALLNEYGNVLVSEGKLKDAARYYRKAVDLAPLLAVAWNNLGVVEGAMGNSMAAENAYRKAIKAAPYYALAYYNLGALHDNQDHYDAAIENYQKAIELDPALLDPRNNPRIATNRHLPTVLVKSYIDRGGSALLPVQSVYPAATRKDPAKKPARGR